LPGAHMQELMRFIDEQEDTGRTRSAITSQNNKSINFNEHFSEPFEESVR
jgi:hypothetical protein